MQIHELNNFSGTPGASDYFATDNGTDTSKISAADLYAPLNARIDNIIAGPAPSAEEIVDARLGADGVTYSSLGDAIRGQVTDLKSDISYGMFDGENLYDTTILGVNNNTAVTNNGDGTFTFGTSDYGNTVIGKKVSLKAGCYKLYGVPQGTAHLGTSYRLADAIVKNSSSNPKVFTLTADADLFLAFSILAKPSSAFTIKPYLCQTKVADNTRQIAESNAKNLFLINDSAEVTDSGITYSVKDNVYRMEGRTGSSLWFTNLYNSAQKLPSWCVAGNRVYIQFDAEGEYDGVLLQMYKYVNGALTLMFGTNESGYYTIPSDFDGDGLLIRIKISASTSVDFRVRIGILSTMSNDELAKKTHKRAFSHNVVFFGDSIMWGRNGDGNSTDRTPFTIPNTVATALALKTANYGVSGMGFISNASSPTNAYGKISNTDLTPFDTIVMCFGVNDGFNPIGTWDSTDEDTCLGQFNKIVNYIYQQKPSIRLIVIAPFNGRNVGTFPKYWYGTVPSTAYSRGALSDAIKEACEYYNIPYIEQTNGPINGFTIGTLIGTDGVHPSNEGYKRIGEWISGELARLIG